jgi:hypothetical protein
MRRVVFQQNLLERLQRKVAGSILDELIEFFN